MTAQSHPSEWTQADHEQAVDRVRHKPGSRRECCTEDEAREAVGVALRDLLNGGKPVTVGLVVTAARRDLIDARRKARGHKAFATDADRSLAANAGYLSEFTLAACNRHDEVFREVTLLRPQRRCLRPDDTRGPETARSAPRALFVLTFGAPWDDHRFFVEALLREHRRTWPIVAKTFNRSARLETRTALVHLSVPLSIRIKGSRVGLTARELAVIALQLEPVPSWEDLRGTTCDAAINRARADLDRLIDAMKKSERHPLTFPTLAGDPIVVRPTRRSECPPLVSAAFGRDHVGAHAPID